MPRLAAAAAFAAGLLLAGPVAACRCIANTDWRAKADLIAEGRIIAVGKPVDASGERQVRLQVKHVSKGRAGALIDFMAADFRENSCGIGLFEGYEAQFLLAKTPGGYVTNMCLMMGADRK